MQTLDNSMRLRPRRNLLGLGAAPADRGGPATSPTRASSTVADRVTRRAAEKLDGDAAVGLTEALLNIPTTAHIMGGAVIGERPRPA